MLLFPLIFLLPKVYHNINIFNKQKPWFNHRRSKRNLIFRRSRNLEENTKRLEKHYKKVLDTSIRTHRQKIRNKINNLKSTNPREYWKIINSGKKKNSPEIPIDILFDYFRNLNAKGDDIDDSDINQNNNRVRELNNIINAPITREEIENAIKSLKNNKSSGDDYILNEYIKHLFESISDVYVKLFNIIFDSGSIPEQWLYGNIIPVYKNKGDKHDPKNFRSITILSCIGKLFTSILNFILNDFSDEYSLICENQGGFRKGYSTIDNIFLFYMF